MTCDYCGAKDSDADEGEEIEFITYSAGDESMDVCDSCREHMID
jgi:hypothetical protein